jgi:hypothetical protein
MKSKSTSRMPGKPVQALSRSRLPKSAPDLPMKGTLKPDSRLANLSKSKPKANTPR